MFKHRKVSEINQRFESIPSLYNTTTQNVKPSKPKRLPSAELMKITT